jgi:short-subunit dehydrogenase
VPAARVAEEGYQGLIQGRRLVIPGFLNKVLAFLPRIFPRSLVLTLAGLRQSKRQEMSKEMSKELSKALSKDRPAPLT